MRMGIRSRVKTEVFTYVTKNGLAYVLSDKIVLFQGKLAVSNQEEQTMLTLPRKFDNVQRKTTQRSKIRPRVCFAKPPVWVRFGDGGGGASRE